MSNSTIITIISIFLLLLFGFVSHLVMFMTYFWLCTQGSVLVESQRPCGVREIKARITAYKETLPTALSLKPQQNLLYGTCLFLKTLCIQLINCGLYILLMKRKWIRKRNKTKGIRVQNKKGNIPVSSLSKTFDVEDIGSGKPNSTFSSTCL